MAKVKLITVGDKVVYFVLADPKEVYQPEIPKVESKTEEKAKKTIKEKKIDVVAPSAKPADNMPVA